MEDIFINSGEIILCMHNKYDILYCLMIDNSNNDLIFVVYAKSNNNTTNGNLIIDIAANKSHNHDFPIKSLDF